MNIDANYLAVVFNSTIRMTTPILFVALGSALCNRVFIFNIGLEGMMLTGAFAAIVANFYTHSVLASIVAAMVASMLVAWVAGIFMVKFKGAMLVVGVSINTLMGGLTTFLMQLVFHVQGAYVSSDLVSLPKINVDFLGNSHVLKTMFGSLTWLDLFAFVAAILLYFHLFRTVTGFRMRSVGINKPAAESLGIKADRIQILTVVFSGLLSGLGGCLLSMGGVTMFAQNMTAGRGFIAIAAIYCGRGNPVACTMYAILFSIANALAEYFSLQVSASLLLKVVPYVVMVIVLSIASIVNRRKVRARGAFSEN